jgi:hypothetical protein
MRKIVLLVLCLIAAQRLSAQEIAVKGVVGRWVIANITPEEARAKAIEEAKKEALRRAGVKETVRASDALTTRSTDNEYSQMFNSFSLIELSGGITDYAIVRDEQEKSSIDGKFYAVVALDAKVKKYSTVADPEFKISVNGVRSQGYKNGEALTLAVRPHKEGYLKIFLFEDTETASQVYPNEYEKSRLLRANEAVNFPTIPSIDYSIEKKTSEKLEHNLLLLVYTKSNIPFYGATTYQRILNWVNGIEPCEREVVMEDILIVN